MANVITVWALMDGAVISVLRGEGKRFFIVTGALEGDRKDLGVTGHLVDNSNPENVRVAGQVLMYSRVGRNQGPEFYWAILFMLPPNLPDTAGSAGPYYDLIFTAHHTHKSKVGKTVAETGDEEEHPGASPKRIARVSIVTGAGVAVSIGTPQQSGPINRNIFMPTGSYTPDDNAKPTVVTMTRRVMVDGQWTDYGTPIGAGTIYSNAGGWYAAFSALTAGYTFRLDVTNNTMTKSVDGLTT